MDSWPPWRTRNQRSRISSRPSRLFFCVRRGSSLLISAPEQEPLTAKFAKKKARSTRRNARHEQRYYRIHTENLGSPSRTCSWSFGASPFFQRAVRDLTR